MALGANVLNILRVSVKNVSLSQLRYYTRWSHRRPLKVYSPEEYKEMEQKQWKNEDISVAEKSTKKDPVELIEEETSFEPIKFKIKTKKVTKPLVATHQKTKDSVAVANTDMLETIIDSEGNLVYTKLENNNFTVGAMLAEVKSKKEKKDKDFILLEGKRLIKDALLSGCHLKYIIFSRKNEIEYLKPYLPKLGAHLYKMPYKKMQLWSDLTTNPGIMGIFKIPNTENFQPKESLPLTVICDNIREPGNLGAVLRTCAAVGCQEVILTKGCVNLWDTKVLRSSVGAHFKLKIQKNVEWETIEEEMGANANVYIADNKVVSDNVNNSENLEIILEKIPVLPYCGVNFRSDKQTVLIIGGETYGISRNSYELALKMSGIRLNIPLNNDMDSLNVGTALGIILFEAKKQIQSQECI